MKKQRKVGSPYTIDGYLPLRQAIPLYPNYLYNAEQINRTYNNIMSLGYFKSTRITFDELPAPDSTTSSPTSATPTTRWPRNIRRKAICVATFSARRSSNRVTRSTWKGRPLRVSTD